MRALARRDSLVPVLSQCHCLTVTMDPSEWVRPRAMDYASTDSGRPSLEHSTSTLQDKNSCDALLRYVSELAQTKGGSSEVGSQCTERHTSMIVAMLECSPLHTALLCGNAADVKQLFGLTSLQCR